MGKRPHRNEPLATGWLLTGVLGVRATSVNLSEFHYAPSPSWGLRGEYLWHSIGKRRVAISLGLGFYSVQFIPHWAHSYPTEYVGQDDSQAGSSSVYGSYRFVEQFLFMPEFKLGATRGRVFAYWGPPLLGLDVVHGAYRREIPGTGEFSDEVYHRAQIVRVALATSAGALVRVGRRFLVGGEVFGIFASPFQHEDSINAYPVSLDVGGELRLLLAGSL